MGVIYFMPPYKLFFSSILLFILGVFVISLELSFWCILLLALIAFIIFLYNFGFRLITLISLFVIIGGFYYLIDDYRYYSNLKLINGATEYIGIINSNPEYKEDYQSFYLKAQKNTEYSNTKILIRTNIDKKYSYGDELQITGKIEAPPDNYFGKYLAKERINGISNNPDINLFATEKGSSLLYTLFNIKIYIDSSFKQILSKDESAFLSGITLGITSGFSKEMLNQFSLSGTRHLVAISGLNMTIITTLFLTIFSYFLPKKYSFALTSIAVIGFTAMIGFELSAVRAAIMGIIAGASRTIIGRPHLHYNAIAFAAIVMILVNPKVLVYDIGFVLSFLAVIGIIYLTPILLFILNATKNKGFLDWKEMIAMTTAAQVTTAPVLITQFDNFSLISFLANILVLPAIPILTWIGFLMGALSFISITLEVIIGLIISPILKYVLFVIDVCSKFGVVIDPNLNWPIILVYYGMLIYLIYEFHTNDKYSMNHKHNK